MCCLEDKPSWDFVNGNTLWNEVGMDKSRNYPQQAQGNFNSTNLFKRESTADDTKRFTGEMNNPSDHTSKPPLQPSPNIVDEVTFSKTHSTCR